LNQGLCLGWGKKRKVFLQNPASQNKPVEGAAAPRLVQSRTSTWLAPYGENFDSQQQPTKKTRPIANKPIRLADEFSPFQKPVSRLEL